MKKLLTIILLLLIFQNFAQVSIKIIDAETNLPITEHEIVRKNNQGKILESRSPNEKGIVKFEDHSGVIMIPLKIEGYSHFPIELWKTDKNNELLYFLYPDSFLAATAYSNSNKKESENSKQEESEIPEIIIPIKEVNTKEDNEKDHDTSIKEHPDKDASFPGGATAMQKFLAGEIIYPRHSMVMGARQSIY